MFHEWQLQHQHSRRSHLSLATPGSAARERRAGTPRSLPGRRQEASAGTRASEPAAVPRNSGSRVASGAKDGQRREKLQGVARGGCKVVGKELLQRVSKWRANTLVLLQPIEWHWWWKPKPVRVM